MLDRTAKDGLGAAYRAGFALAIERGADVCVQLDADLSHDPAVLPALVSNIEHGADLAIGSRYVPGGITEDWPWRRRALSRGATATPPACSGWRSTTPPPASAPTRSTPCDGWTTRACTTEGYGFQVEMTHRLVRAEGKIVEFPITFRERTRRRVEALERDRQRGVPAGGSTLAAGHRRGRRQRRRHGG